MKTYELQRIEMRIVREPEFNEKLLRQVLDQVIPGEALTKDLKKAVRTLYYLADEWGDDFVASTPNDIDDQALAEVKGTCEDTANEGVFMLPAAPPL